MKLYLVSQNVNSGYDTYDAMVVAAESEDEARLINPGGFHKFHDDSWYFQYADGREEPEPDDSWANPNQLEVKYLGETNESAGVLLSSFHAG